MPQQLRLCRAGARRPKLLPGLQYGCRDPRTSTAFPGTTAGSWIKNRALEIPTNAQTGYRVSKMFNLINLFFWAQRKKNCKKNGSVRARCKNRIKGKAWESRGHQIISTVIFRYKKALKKELCGQDTTWAQTVYLLLKAGVQKLQEVRVLGTGRIGDSTQYF